MWVDPKGQIVAQASDEHDEVLTLDLDLAVIPGIRNDWGFFRDRRPDLYGGLAN